MFRIVAFVFALLGLNLARGFAADGENHFFNIQREPDSITLTTEADNSELTPVAPGMWKNNQAEIQFHSENDELVIKLVAPRSEPKAIQFNWQVNPDANDKYLGDAWERAYGDLAWLPLDPKRVMPWYFLASDGQLTHGYGVKTGPSALCYWTLDEHTVSLHADVRCGGMGVQLGNRILKVCTVASRRGQPGETPFAAAHAFCQVMCPHPRLPKEPVYGFNDWYCTYGHDTADEFLANVAFLKSIGPDNGNQPFAVADDGWQWKGKNGKEEALWNETEPHFSATLTMTEFAKKVSALGARPGLWYRPLIASESQPKNWRLQRDSDMLDPTVPGVQALIQTTVARFHRWGFQMIKHDYTTFDICGRWGKDMGAEVTPDGWAFADRSKTTAEVIRDLYQEIREAAGNDTLIIGCNTMGHLAAGLFEMQRVGDDTSGREWERTRTMGVNCLAFRAPQNGAFFAIDADCAGQTSSNSVPWVKNSQWLDLLAHSGTPLFVSFPHQTINADQENALREALKSASQPQPVAVPLDWMTTRTPEKWRFGKTEANFTW